MTVKSNYKLDDRIKSMDDVQTCLQYDDSYIGERGYFATDLSDLSDLTGCLHDTLAQIISDGGGDDIFRTPHDVDNDNWGSRFFVPERLLKSVEKKYRPFTGIEFAEKFNLKLGGIIRLREKKHEYALTQYEYKIVFTGYRWCGDVFEVFLNGEWYTMHTLFENYEYFENDEWHKFGIEVEE